MERHPDVDAYLAQAQQWPNEIAALRPILRGSGLTETIKWGKPCYCHEGRNVAILQEMKGFLALMFFKGALLDDPAGVLEQQGPNSHAARRMCFTSVAQVHELAETLKAYLEEAIEIEEAGRRVSPAPAPELATELQRRLAADAAFRSAFEALSPGRQREYNLHLSAAKQAKTREARLDKCAPRILAGKGLRDR